MKTIVLITREDSEKVTHVMVFLCSNFVEANHFCHLVNRLSLAGGDKLVARKITTGTEYSLEKYKPFGFDDFVKLDNRTIQCVMREMDSQILAVALKDAKKDVRDAFFRNMSKRASSMLEEDMEYMGPATEQDIEKARQFTLDIYDDLSMENRFDEAWARYENSKNSKIKNQDDSGDSNHLVLVFYGAETTADRVSVYLFDEYDILGIMILIDKIQLLDISIALKENNNVLLIILPSASKRLDCRQIAFVLSADRARYFTEELCVDLDGSESEFYHFLCEWTSGCNCNFIHRNYGIILQEKSLLVWSWR